MNTVAIDDLASLLACYWLISFLKISLLHREIPKWGQYSETLVVQCAIDSGFGFAISFLEISCSFDLVLCHCSFTCFFLMLARFLRKQTCPFCGVPKVQTVLLPWLWHLYPWEFAQLPRLWQLQAFQSCCCEWELRILLLWKFILHSLSHFLEFGTLNFKENFAGKWLILWTFNIFPPFREKRMQILLSLFTFNEPCYSTIEKLSRAGTSNLNNIKHMIREGRERINLMNNIFL